MENYQNIFKRYEIKFLPTHEQRRRLEELMSEYMTPDKFGKSRVCTMYFDTPDKRLIRNSLEKPVYKEKLRLRSYGMASDADTVFVELKKKYKSVVYKRRVGMSLHCAMEYLCECGEPEARSQITDEVDWFLSFYGNLQPSVMIYYDRTAYACPSDAGFRITFDENILWRDYDFSLKSPVCGAPILGENKVLLEVKTAGALPLWLTEFLSEEGIFKTSFSKYGNAYLAMLHDKNEAKKIILPEIITAEGVFYSA